MGHNAERIAIILTVSASLLVSLLDLLGLLGAIPWLAGRTPAITLLLLALLAGYVSLERFGRLAHIERTIIMSTDKILASLSGVEAVLLPSSEDAFSYMSARISSATGRIDHAALSPPITRRSPYSKKWERAIERVLKGNKVLYRYVASFGDEVRLERVRRHLSNPKIEKYYVRYYESGETSPPALSFMLVDDSEVVMHYPYDPGQPETFLSIKHPDVVRLFAAHFRSLWDKASPFIADRDS